MLMVAMNYTHGGLFPINLKIIQLYHNIIALDGKAD